jgi:hypothetical protein
MPSETRVSIRAVSIVIGRSRPCVRPDADFMHATRVAPAPIVTWSTVVWILPSCVGTVEALKRSIMRVWAGHSTDATRRSSAKSAIGKPSACPTMRVCERAGSERRAGWGWTRPASRVIETFTRVVSARNARIATRHGTSTRSGRDRSITTTRGIHCETPTPPWNARHATRRGTRSFPDSTSVGRATRIPTPVKPRWRGRSWTAPRVTTHVGSPRRPTAPCGTLLHATPSRIDIGARGAAAVTVRETPANFGFASRSAPARTATETPMAGSRVWREIGATHATTSKALLPHPSAESGTRRRRSRSRELTWRQGVGRAMGPNVEGRPPRKESSRARRGSCSNSGRRAASIVTPSRIGENSDPPRPTAYGVTTNADSVPLRST